VLEDSIYIDISRYQVRFAAAIDRPSLAQPPVCILPNEIVFRNVGRDRLPVHDLRCGIIGAGILFDRTVLLRPVNVS
jgi:hypothetical protein